MNGFDIRCSLIFILTKFFNFVKIMGENRVKLKNFIFEIFRYKEYKTP